MKFSFMIRSIPNSCQSIEDKHSYFFNCLKKLEGPWCLSGKAPPEVGKPGEFIAEVVLNNFFCVGTKGRIIYQNRQQEFKNQGKYDDHFVLEFDPAKVDYVNLVEKAFFLFVNAFGGYYAYIGNNKSIEMDFDKRRKVDYRKGVVRIFPANYLSSALCEGSFNLTVSQVAKQCQSHAKNLKVENDGIFIVVNNDILNPKQSEVINESFKEVLGY